MSRTRSTPRVACAVLLWCALGAGGREGRGADRGLETAAQGAFDHALRLMDARRYDKACPLLEESLRYDPGMAAKFRLAECYEGQGRLATAWETYLEVAEDARAASMDQRAEFARERAAALEPKLSSLWVSVSSRAAARRGLEIHCDGALLPRAFWDKPLPIDPGTHRVTVNAPGRRTWARHIDVPAGGTTATVHFESFPESLVAEPSDEPATSGQTIAGVVLASTGLLALGAGLGVGLSSRGRYDDADEHCVEQYCDPEGMLIREGAMDQATVGTVLFAVGSGVLVGGGVLWLTAPDADSIDERDEPAHGRTAAAREATGIGISCRGIMVRTTW